MQVHATYHGDNTTTPAAAGNCRFRIAKAVAITRPPPAESPPITNLETSIALNPASSGGLVRYKYAAKESTRAAGKGC
jgi:hypothetical protein